MASIIGGRPAWAIQAIKEQQVKEAKREPRPLATIESTSPAFLAARAFTERQEGRYVNNPEDEGGPTKFGISQRAYPKLNIKGLTRNQAREIYKRDYWDKIQGDELPEDVARVVFDAAINSGVDIASKQLQLAVGAVPDGIIGPRTLRQLQSYLQKEDSFTLAKALLKKRKWFYTLIAKRNPKLTVFLEEWLDRVDRLDKELKNEEQQRRADLVNELAKRARR